MTKNSISVPRAEAVKTIIENLNYNPQKETVNLEDSLNRVAYEDIHSKNTLPNSLNSRWDCVIFYYDKWLKDNGDTSKWQRDIDYSLGNTGVGILGNYDTGVKVENTIINEEDRLVLLETDIVRGQNTQPAGEWLKTGDVIIKKDTKILPAHLNIMASAGVTEVPVIKKPKVGFIATGNELVPPGETPPLHKNVESNSISIAAKCSIWGAEYINLPIVPDNMAQIAAAILYASEVCDIIIIGAGTARGTEDHTQELLENLGKVFFHMVDHGPGKKTSFTVVNNKPVIGLVGPPMGEEMTFDFYVLPAIAYCLNQKYRIPVVQCILDKDLSGHPRVDFYMPLHIYKKDGEYHAVRAADIAGDSALILSTINGYHFLPFGSGGRQAGENIIAELSPSVPVEEE